MQATHPAAHPVLTSALRRWSQAPAVTVKRLRATSPFEVEFRGADQGQVQDAARTYANGIDAYRSPAVSMTRLEGSEWVTTIRFYSVD